MPARIAGDIFQRLDSVITADWQALETRILPAFGLGPIIATAWGESRYFLVLHWIHRLL